MPFYYSKPVQGEQPWLYWGPSATEKPFDITVYFQNLFVNAPGGDITADMFRLTVTTVQDQTSLPYKIVVDRNGGIWKFDQSKVRAAVRNSFANFVLLLERQGLLPGMALIVKRALSQYLPLTFDEILLYQYGWDQQAGYFDVSPGMRLKVDFQTHQSIDPSTTNALNGFVGNGSNTLDVVSYRGSDGNLLTGFNAFTSKMNYAGVQAGVGGLGNAIDLTGQAFAYNYFRILYPSQFPSSDSTGFAGTQQNVTIVGAMTMEMMEEATAAYLKDGQTGTLPVSAAFFRGRAAVTPLIPVFLFGQPQYVALGTTIRNLLEGFGPLPYIQNFSMNFPSQFFYRNLVNSVSSNVWQYRKSDTLTLISTTGKYNGGYQYYGPSSDSFDLPLLAGDAINYRIEGA